MRFLEVDCLAARLIQEKDWTHTPVGAPDTWPQSLRTLLFSVLSSPGPKLLLWGEDLITFFNDAYLKFAGAEFASGIGRPFWELRPDSWPNLGSYIQAALRGKGQLLKDFKCVTRRNGYREEGYVTICYTPILAEDRQVRGVLADLYDETTAVEHREALRQELSRLRYLFEHAPIIIAYATAPGFEVKFANRAFRDFLGGRDLIGRRVEDSIPELRGQRFAELRHTARESGQAVVGVGVPVDLCNTPGGPLETHYVDFIYQPIKSSAGEVGGIFFCGTDVTERHRAQERAERLEHQLLHQSRSSAMGTMAMTLAHELNQPLAAAGAYLAASRHFLASNEADGPELTTHSLELAEGQILRAGGIIRQTRSLIAYGRPRLKQIAIDECIDAAVSLLDANGDLGSMVVTKQIEPGAEHWPADQTQIEQVLTNLIRNASEASAGCPKPEILITAHRVAEGICISVKDTGVGLRGADPQALFNAFERSSERGMGIGLSLCRTIIEAHGGQIWASDNPGEGATFTFLLPEVEQEAEGAAQ